MFGSQEGAKIYGFWQLPDESLGGLVRQLLDREEICSAGLQQWTQSIQAIGSVVPIVPRCEAKSEATQKTEKTNGSDMLSMGQEMQAMKTFATSRFSADLVTLRRKSFKRVFRKLAGKCGIFLSYNFLWCLRHFYVYRAVVPAESAGDVGCQHLVRHRGERGAFSS